MCRPILILQLYLLLHCNCIYCYIAIVYLILSARLHGTYSRKFWSELRKSNVSGAWLPAHRLRICYEQLYTWGHPTRNSIRGATLHLMDCSGAGWGWELSRSRSGCDLIDSVLILRKRSFFGARPADGVPILTPGS